MTENLRNKLSFTVSNMEIKVIKGHTWIELRDIYNKFKNKTIKGKK